MHTQWSFETKNFRVTLATELEPDQTYDGDDEDGSIQADIDSGELVMFWSCVTVTHKPTKIELGSDSLGNSVYKWNEIAEFWTAHRDPDPMNRNCSIMRAARGEITICHYFPGMVKEAIREARVKLAALPDPSAFRLAS